MQNKYPTTCALGNFCHSLLRFLGVCRAPEYVTFTGCTFPPWIDVSACCRRYYYVPLVDEVPLTLFKLIFSIWGFTLMKGQQIMRWLRSWAEKDQNKISFNSRVSVVWEPNTWQTKLTGRRKFYPIDYSPARSSRLWEFKEQVWMNQVTPEQIQFATGLL